MRRIFKILASLVLTLVFMLSSMTVFAAEHRTSASKTNEIPYESYTYWTDYGAEQKTAVYCKPMYETKKIISYETLNSAAISSINDICTDEFGDSYILNSTDSKVYAVDDTYNHLFTIEEILYNGEKLSIDGASGIYVKDKKIYISDTKNARVLVMNKDGVVERMLLLPESRLIPENFLYRPIRVAVDSKNYTYIASDGSYYGALVYSPEMEFLGFYGANTVKATALDVIQNLFDRIFSNDIKKGAAVLALPYQFNDMVVGPKDFIYTSTGATGESEQKGQICMMNPGGKDVLGRQNFNFADNDIALYQRNWLYQNISGIDVDEDGFFYALDSSYGRVFWYDSECNLFSVFGGNLGLGSQKGTFNLANSISVNGTDVLVSDGLKNTVTVFTITDYGRQVRSAQLKILNDDFSSAIEDWTSVLEQDQNSQFAYRGLAKAYYELGDYEKAQKYAKLGADRETYSNALQKNRSDFLADKFGVIFFAVIFLSIGAIVFFAYKKKKNIVFIKNQEVKIAVSSITHPFEAFRLVKEKQAGSMIIATVILAAFYIISAVSDTATSFAFDYFDATSYNSLYTLMSTVGLILLWTVSNWLVCVLLGGIAKLRQIYIVTCYSLIPIIFASAIGLLLTYVLVPDEYVFVTVFQTVCTLYTLFVLIVGIMKIQDFEFGKFVGTTILTVIAMIIVVFLIFLVFLLAQQVFGWFGTLFVELKYR